MRYIAMAIVLLVFASTQSHATWKPDYAKSPLSVQNWFNSARVKGGTTGLAYKRLGIAMCCKQAERLRTKFVGTTGGEWSYYPNPACITKGCLLLPIKDDVVHEDEIHAADPQDDALPEFDEMRAEGVLFIYKGEPSCFWPPTGTGG